MRLRFGWWPAHSMTRPWSLIPWRGCDEEGRAAISFPIPGIGAFHIWYGRPDKPCMVCNERGHHWHDCSEPDDLDTLLAELLATPGGPQRYAAAQAAAAAQNEADIEWLANNPAYLDSPEWIPNDADPADRNRTP